MSLANLCFFIKNGVNGRGSNSLRLKMGWAEFTFGQGIVVGMLPLYRPIFGRNELLPLPALRFRLSKFER